MLFDTDETTSLAGNLDCDTSSNNGCSLLRHHKVKVPGIDLIEIFLRDVKTSNYFGKLHLVILEDYDL